MLACLLAKEELPKRVFKQRGWRSSESDMSAESSVLEYRTGESYLALAAGAGDNVDETASVDFALVSTALGGLGLLLRLDLGSLRLDLA